MPDNRNKRKIRFALGRLKKIFALNIGTILFGALLVYMIFNLVIYLTSSHFTSYQVVSGPLSRNETYTGLAIHQEQVVSAETGGYINYYAREGSKINTSGIVYGVSNQPLEVSDTELSADDMATIRKQMSSYSYSFDSSNFNSVYSFKSQLEGNILRYSGVEYTTSDEEGSTSVTTEGQTLCRAPEDGIVLYSKDGYESINENNISEEDFNQNSYHKEDLKTRENVSAGSDIYTIITDERWSLYIPLTAKQATQLADRDAIRVKFLKDGMTQNGSFSIVEIGDGKYGKIDFNNGLISYASDRFLDIELVTNTQSGLKVPLSAVITKEFYLIPKEYQTSDEDGSSAGFLVSNGSGTEFVSATVYAQKDEMYYVKKSSFEKGTVLVKPNSEDRYVISDTGLLEGVYCINEGYAQFRRISIIDQNEEYCIVEKNTSYGLSQYDYIVFDATDIQEEDILY